MLSDNGKNQYHFWRLDFFGEQANDFKLQGIIKFSLNIRGKEDKWGAARCGNILIHSHHSSRVKFFYESNSSNKLLVDLAVRLYDIYIHGEIILHIIWIPGTRMI